MKHDHAKENTTVISTKKAVFIYILVAIFLFFEMAIQVSPSVMAQSLMHDLSISAFLLGIMSSVYFYTYTGMQIPSGLLLDRFNARHIIFFALLICSIGAIVFGLSENFYAGCLARLFMGFGSAFAFVSVLSVASDLFNKKSFVLLTGITQSLAALGAMAGQFPISFLVEHMGWRLTIISLGSFGIILAIAILWCLDYKKRSDRANKQNFSRNAGIRHDLKIIIKNKHTWLIALYACLMWAPMSGFASLWGVSFAMHFDHLSLSHAAFATSMMWLGLAVGSPLLSMLANTLDNRVLPLSLSALLGAVAFFAILVFKLPTYVLYVLLFFAGAACSGQALSFAVVKNNNSHDVKSTAIAFNNMAVVISGALFQPLMGGLILIFHRMGSVHPYRSSVYVIFFAYLLSMLLAKFFIKENDLEKIFDRNLKKMDNKLI